MVWRTARRLHEALAGRLLAVAEIRHPQLSTVDLVGWQVINVGSYGKHLFIRLAAPPPVNASSPVGPPQLGAPVAERGTHSADISSSNVADIDESVARRISLHSHLRMDGGWWLYRAGERWDGGPSHAIRVILAVNAPLSDEPNGTVPLTAVGYRIHDLAVIRTEHEDRLIGHLGPDLLGENWDLSEALRRIQAQPGRAIAFALLDQRNLAGIGTLFRSEALFIKNLWPWTRVSDVEDLAALVTTAQRLLQINTRRTPQNTTGLPYQTQRHWVFGRNGKRCLRCGHTVQRAVVGDGPATHHRPLFWCPHCQGASS